jgi:drug/metabolite transporter (DMT)-like permease
VTSTLGLLLVTVIWGTTFVAVKSALRDAPPLLFVGLRFALAFVTAATLRPLLSSQRESAPLAPASPGSGKAGILLGAVLAAAYAAQTLGLAVTTPARSAFVTGLNVALVPFWSWCLARRRPGAFPLLGLVLAVGGLWCLTTPQGGSWTRGDSWTVLCALLFALHVVLLTGAGARYDPARLLVIQLGVAAALCLGAAAVLEPIRFRWSLRLLAALALTAWLATILTTWLQLKLQPRVGAARSAVIFAAEPLFAALFSWMVIGERLSAAAWAGGALIVAGMLLSEIGSGFAAAERS